jgi:hypothetical protein
MTELLDVEGPWNPDLLAVMATEAQRIQAREKKDAFLGTVAAVATFFGKEGSEMSRSYGAMLDAALETIEAMKIERAGGTPATPAEKAAEKLEKLIHSLPGMKG